MKPFFRSAIALLFGGVLTVGIHSCIDQDDYDFDKLSEKVDWTPNMTVPVGYGTYSLEYLLDQHETEEEDQVIFFENDNVYIRYTEEDIFSYSVEEVLEFPNVPNITDEIAIPPIPVPIDYDLLPDDTKNFEAAFDIEVETGEDGITLYKVILNSILNIQFNNPLNTNAIVTLTFPNSRISGTTDTEYSHSFNISPGLTTDETTISNVEFSFKTPYSTNNALQVHLDVEILDNGGTISNTTGGNLAFSLSLNSFDFQLAKGDFGNQTIDLDSDEFDLDVEFWDDIDGTYHFANPSVSLTAQNSVGVPFEINAQMVGYSTDGASQALNPQAQRPNYPRNVTEVENGITTNIIYNNQNSDIADLMSLPPSDRITYSGTISLNPAGNVTPSTPNIISNNSSIDVDLQVEIPLEFSAENLNFRDTIKDIDIDDPDKIMNAAILITAKNGFPLAAQVDHIYLVDANYNQLDEIVDSQVLSAAPVDSQGNVLTDELVFVTHRIELTTEQIKNLENTEHILVNLSVSTSGAQDLPDGQEATPVKFKASHQLEFKLAVQAQINLNN